MTATRETSSGGGFPETRWSLVMRVQSSDAALSREALAELCETYWYPLYSWLRRDGESPEDAEDWVQGLFSSLIAREDLARVAREKGRLRSFFLASLKHYSSKEREKARAGKRGGGAPHIRLDRAGADARYACEPEDPSLTPDRLYDRAWALLVLERAFAALREEYCRRGAEAVYEALKPHLAWNATDRPLKDVAADLGMKEGAVRVAVLRLRKRFRRLLEKEISLTVEGDEAVEEELESLRRILSS